VTAYDCASRSIDWWRVHQYVLPLLEEVRCWPMAGTIAWTALSDGDPAKRAALFDFARHHALRVDTSQNALADASREISKSPDWSVIAGRLIRRTGVYIPREVA
jgi:Protein of unknown function (DUF2742)